MKRILVLLLSLIVLVVGSTSVLAETRIQSDNNTSTIVTEISQDEYIASIMETEGLTYTQALDRIPSIKERGSDEVVKYATVDKHAHTIRDATGSYTKNIRMRVNVCYIYNRGLGEATAISDVSGEYVYLENNTDPNASFEHGNFAHNLTYNRCEVTVYGQFYYLVNGVTVTIGGDILDFSQEVGGYQIVTEVLDIDAVYTLDDL